MIWSMHTIIVPEYPSPNEFLVYQTRTQAMVKLDRELKETVDHFSDPRFFRQKCHYAGQLEKLHQMGLIVENEQEDIIKLKDFLQQLKYNVDNFFGVQILTTYACNFKCVYCFQETSREMEHMDASTQEQAILWIQRRMEKLGYRMLHINYYGGEPLLNPGAIETISSKMKKWCEEKGYGFRFTLQTNGYLLTPELVNNYKALGLGSIRISVDGLKEVHDCNRPLRGGQGTFDRIIQNIIDVADSIKLHISCTYENGNPEPIVDLIHYFEERGVLHKLGRFLFGPTHAVLGGQNNAADIQRSQCQCHHTDDAFAASQERIFSVMKEKGLEIRNGMALTACPLTRENSGVTIDQKGRIFRCNSLLGHEEFSIGNVFLDEFAEIQKEFRDLDVWRQCPQDCKYLPICSGGCRLMSFLEHRNFRVPSCKKDYLNKVAADVIKRDYEKIMVPVL